MRIIADLATDEIVQVEKNGAIGDQITTNGKYIVDAPVGLDEEVSASSYVLPVDGGDVSSLAFNRLLARFDGYDNIVFNTFVDVSDISDLDGSSSLNNTNATVIPDPNPLDGLTYDGIYVPRYQTGSAVSPTGTAPNSTAVLPPNTTVVPPRPGILLTDTIDIEPLVGVNGTSDFMVYWKIYRITTSDDVVSDYGATAGINTPARRVVEEIDQEIEGFFVALSANDGSLYQRVPRLTPFSACSPGTDIRLAFVNTRPEKIYVASYAILF